MQLTDIVTLADGRTKFVRDILADLEQLRNAMIGDGQLPKGYPAAGSPLAKLDRPQATVTLSAEDRAAIVTELRAGLPSLADIAKAVADEQARRQQS